MVYIIQLLQDESIAQHQNDLKYEAINTVLKLWKINLVNWSNQAVSLMVIFNDRIKLGIITGMGNGESIIVTTE